MPEGRLEKALSVGANTVMPLTELFSWLFIWSPTWVLLSRRMKVPNSPAFSRTAVMLGGPAGAGESAS